jgi:hypothetical protein
MTIMAHVPEGAAKLPMADPLAVKFTRSLTTVGVVNGGTGGGEATIAEFGSEELGSATAAAFISFPGVRLDACTTGANDSIEKTDRQRTLIIIAANIFFIFLFSLSLFGREQKIVYRPVCVLMLCGNVFYLNQNKLLNQGSDSEVNAHWGAHDEKPGKD